MVAPEVAERIVARRAVGDPLSAITGSLHMTPGEVRSVLRVRAGVAPEVAEPIVASGAAGELVLAAIRGAEQAAAEALDGSGVLDAAERASVGWARGE